MHSLCKKYWILPDYTIKKVKFAWHYDDLVQNNEKYSELFRLKLPKKIDDTTCRKAALKVGFIRLNYKINTGELTIETIKKNLTDESVKVIRGFIKEHSKLIDSIRLIVLSNDFKSYTENFVFVFGEQNKESLLPL